MFFFLLETNDSDIGFIPGAFRSTSLRLGWLLNDLLNKCTSYLICLNDLLCEHNLLKIIIRHVHVIYTISLLVRQIGKDICNPFISQRRPYGSLSRNERVSN